MHTHAKAFWRSERGATAIEYGLIAALVSVSIIVVLAAMGHGLVEIFTYIADVLNGIAESFTAAPSPAPAPAPAP